MTHLWSLISGRTLIPNHTFKICSSLCLYIATLLQSLTSQLINFLPKRTLRTVKDFITFYNAETQNTQNQEVLTHRNKMVQSDCAFLKRDNSFGMSQGFIFSAIVIIVMIIARAYAMRPSIHFSIIADALICIF